MNLNAKSTVLASLLVAASSLAMAAPQSYAPDQGHSFASYESDHGGFSLQHRVFDQTGRSFTGDPGKGIGNVNGAIKVTFLAAGLAVHEGLRTFDR